MLAVALNQRPGNRLIQWRVMAAAVTVGTTLSAAALAASPDVVISQVYGGGGNTGAIYKNDFIELYNRGTSAVSVDGWSVQYAPAALPTFQSTNLSGSIAPGGYYLVQESIGLNGTTNLPTPDAIGSIPLGATAGRVALVASTALLGCGSQCAGLPILKDFVGFGTTANNFEGSGPAPAPSNTTAVLRAGAGAIDTDDNAADFSAGAPNPRNSTFTPVVNGACSAANGTIIAAASPANLCSAGTPSAVAGSGHPWSWTCIGSVGGSTATCSAIIRGYAVTITTDGNGSLAGSTSQNVDFGQSSTPVAAVPNPGFTFTSWTDVNGFFSTANPLILSDVQATRDISAHFSAAVTDGDSDVPLPPWAAFLAATGLYAVLVRRRST